MSNLDNIKETILAEAQAEAQAILDRAEANSRDYLDSIRKEQAAAIERQKVYASEKAAGLQDQIAATARLKARDRVLSAQENLIDEVLKQSRERLLAMSDADLSQLIQEKLAEHQYQEGEVLILPEGRELDVNCPLPREYDPELQVGFALTRKGVTLKYDFLEVLEYGREEWEPLILRTIAEDR